ncbi:TetR/AcrR family transcriptional regulator; helix-turn-helix transcriptional regulator [Pseudonocardia sp. DSM 110487]|jgi:AcrR family transcriptional regulator|uniref:TetR/AcrR family transcriptional regulator n=1 Tax=Pseudonocardia sp. DSM 110487 TaxID=2865833 RepID=UPI001C6A4428|nr:TetR/AcrR family transcriptional regulator [Pseudonocardia sp. DSM 110487]QYN36311.1 TetR/AcrR family transcriptional regulator; helix-turn-helix transcriptional regulator [Pseudonocardia sp. DSM 110487]
MAAVGPPRVGVPPTERADAARNRARVLAAAAELFRSREDPRAVTMDDVARAAGVGRATLYRRYPDIVSIAEALLGEDERVLQEELLRGAPPLGPGAPPAERLAAFYAALVEHLDRHLPLVLAVDAGAARFAVGSYGFWRAHVRSLLVEAGVPDPDAMVDALLAPLAAEVFRHQLASGVTPAKVADALAHLARRLLSDAGT